MRSTGSTRNHCTRRYPKFVVRAVHVCVSTNVHALGIRVDLGSTGNAAATVGVGLMSRHPDGCAVGQDAVSVRVHFGEVAADAVTVDFFAWTMRYEVREV